MEDFNTLTYSNCKSFLPLKEGSRAIVVKVYDGDTITLAFFRDGEPTRISCRINGIDTPELRRSSEYEKALAYEAKDLLSNVLLGKIVTIINPGKEKYGRVLCDLSTDDVPSVRDYMIQYPRLCLPYDGGKKTTWDPKVDVDMLD